MDSEQFILVVEDDSRTADAICALLAAEGFPRLEVVGTAGAAEERIRGGEPDLILVDLGLPDRDGTDLIRRLRASACGSLILVVTSATADETIVDALRAGADGYLFKDDLDHRLAGAIRDLAAGGSALSGGAARVVLRHLRPEGERVVALSPSLTPKESAVLEHLSSGASYREIADNLDVRLNTVRTHIRSLYDKLGVENRAEAVNLAWRFGLLALPAP